MMGANSILQANVKKNYLFASFLIALAVLTLDQMTKMIAKSYIVEPLDVFPCFNLVLVLNTGAAWGIFAGKSVFLLSVSAIVLFLMFVFHAKLTDGWRERYYALALIAGGIAGNAIDRIWWKAVIDFLDFYVGKYHWPAFNVADSAICVGVGIFIISSWLRPEPKKKYAIR